VTISRAKFKVDYPAGFMLVAAMNPCPCGYYNHPTKECTCGSVNVQRYLNKVSGPLLDRIDLHVEVTPVLYEDLANQEPEEGSKEISIRASKARKIQNERFETMSFHCNAHMNSSAIKENCSLTYDCKEILRKAMNNLGLSARAYDRILKVSRTIADLDDAQLIEPKHITEAILYRSLDRENWAG
jgi:magnesium chelatase family protein